jgi:uncharacterized protein (TIGR02266 family)
MDGADDANRRAHEDTMTPRRPSSESRKHARAPYREGVRYFEWDRARMAQGTEISAGGMFLKTSAPLAEGKMVTLRLALPGSSAGFTVLARVIRTVQGGILREPGMGVQFLDITPGARALIQHFVEGRRAA